MPTAFELFFILSMLKLSFSGLAAQNIADSTIQKINGERAFYETLGKIYPPESSVTISETTIGGVKSYWFNQSLTNSKHIIIYLHGGV
jgi:epsilon-lactone hydrolase